MDLKALIVIVGVISCAIGMPMSFLNFRSEGFLWRFFFGCVFSGSAFLFVFSLIALTFAIQKDSLGGTLGCIPAVLLFGMPFYMPLVNKIRKG